MKITLGQKAFIRLLKENKKWAAIPTKNGSVQLSFIAKGKAITVYFVPVGNGMFNIKPASYKYRSVCSHFDYGESEVRFSRNKIILQHLLRTLNESRIAPYIANLDTFLRVNMNNPKTDKIKMEENLKKIIKNS